MKRFEIHLFVCENQRAPGHPKGSCADKNSVEIRQKFKRRITELGINAGIRINSAGCLDACEFGAVLVVYPEGIWYGNVTLDDVDEIIERHLINKNPVDRLIIKEGSFYSND